MRRPPDALTSIGLAALLLAGCAPTLDLDTDRPPSQALPSHAASHLKDPLVAANRGVCVRLLDPTRHALIMSPYFVPSATDMAEDVMRPERSFRPQLVVGTSDQKIVKRLQWIDVHQGAERTFELESEATPIQRGLLRAMQALPIEEYL